MNVPAESANGQRAVAFGSIAGLLAFGFGSGLAPRAPGTAGTVMAIPFALLLIQVPSPLFWLLLLALFGLGVWACQRASEQLGQHDPGGIVWDEMLGFWLTVSLVPVDWAWWLAAFLLFRFFDIAKPWPVSWAERKFSGGLGIMMDDVIAALYALGLLLAARWWLIPG